MWPHTVCASTEYGPVLLYCSESETLSTSPLRWLYFHLVIFQSNLGGHPKYLTSWCTSAVLHIHNLCRKINVSFVTTYADFEKRGRGKGVRRRRAEVCGLLFSSLYRFQTVSFCLLPQQLCIDHFQFVRPTTCAGWLIQCVKVCMCVACLHICLCLIYIPSCLMECAEHWQLRPCTVTHPGKYRKFVPNAIHATEKT